MAYTEAGKRATMKYIKSTYDRIEIKVPKGMKSAIEEHAKGKGKSVNGLLNALLRKDMGLTAWPEKEGTAE